MPTAVDLLLDKAPDDSAEAASKKQARIDAALNLLLNDLDQKLNRYVAFRYEKEAEWRIAEEQYAGVNSVETRYGDKKQAAMGNITVTNKPAVNITRPKTNIAVARLQDIQFPTGTEFNFSVNPTPVPELHELIGNSEPIPGGEGQTIGDAAYATLNTAKELARRMEAKIHDRFVETQYAKRCRMAMDQMGRLGTGVLKAPILSHKRRKKYTSLTGSDGKQVQSLSYDAEIVPTVQWVDIRAWFPDPSARPGTSIMDSFEWHPMTPQEMVLLSKNPAYMPERIRSVLDQEPNYTHIAKSQLMSIIGNTVTEFDKRYSVMEYHGPVSKEVLFELDLISEKEKDDSLLIIQGEVWFVNDQIIRVSVSPLEGDEEIPYLVCTWDDDQNSVFGHGIPYLMRHAARVVSSSWLMLLDNAGLTAGPQIVLNKEMIVPANPAEGWEIKPMKIWYLTEYGSSVKDAMQFVNVPTQQETIQNIIELALQFADIESSIPAILQGEIPTGNNTFGGVAMIMTASHIVQKRISEKWDDAITIPCVERFYHYEMQYGEDEGIKGDFEVNAGGATERIDKQIKAQDLERIMGMAGSNDQFMQHLDIGLAFREWVATTRAGDILKPMAEVEAAQQAAAENPPPDPALIMAQAKMKSADAALAKIELDKERSAAELELKAQVEEARVDKENREILTRQEENQIKLQVAQMAREDQLIKLAADRQTSVSKMANELQIAVMDQETKRLLKSADIDKFNTEIALKKKMGEGI